MRVYRDKTPRHRLLERDLATQRGVCVLCGPTRLRVRTRNGKPYFACRQSPAELRKRAKANARARFRVRLPTDYRRFRKPTCESCGFVPVVVAQLCIHHKDHNHENDEPANLATLCHNCHFLVHNPPKNGVACGDT